MKYVLFAMSVCFLYIIYNFEIFSTVDSSMASKMAAKWKFLFIGYILHFFLKKSSHVCYCAFLTSLRMYHASDLFIIKAVLDI